MKPKLSICILLVVIGGEAIRAQEQPSKEAKVDYTSFLQLSMELDEFRTSRLIDIATFNTYSTDQNTIILDTRSKKAFDEIHVEGAIHLNFSDFTEKALAAIIPNTKTRILIYCNNNFESPRKALMNKRRPLALNIPTFINLYGYGYENLYELKDYLKEDDSRIQFKSADY